jgi:CheY-like chemotaxis protein
MRGKPSTRESGRLTAHAMKGDKERCLACGMDGYVTKPIKLEELFLVMENAAPGITRAPDAKDRLPQRPETPAHK